MSGNLLSDCCNYSISRYRNGFSCCNDTASSGGIHITKLHNVTQQHSVFQSLRSQELFEFHAVLYCHNKLFLICRHIPFGSAVYQIYMLYAFGAFCCSGCIHSCISAADYYNIFAQIQIAVMFLKVC